MALQLTGAFKREALPNLQARMPAIVIGGGLTAIDTATELMAYYPLRVEMTLTQYEVIAAELGEARNARVVRPGGARSARRVSDPRSRGARRARTGGAHWGAAGLRAAGALVGRPSRSRIASAWSIRRHTA